MSEKNVGPKTRSNYPAKICLRFTCPARPLRGDAGCSGCYNFDHDPRDKPFTKQDAAHYYSRTKHYGRASSLKPTRLQDQDMDTTGGNK